MEGTFWSSMPVGSASARELLETIVRLGGEELPAAGRLAERALRSRDLHELAERVTTLYGISLEHRHPVIADLADSVLAWIEDARDADATSRRAGSLRSSRLLSRRDGPLRAPRADAGP